MNSAPRRKREGRFPALPTNPYGADLLADVVLDVVPGPGLIRRAFDAAQMCPEAIALAASATTRAEREAVIASVAALARRTACAIPF